MRVYCVKSVGDDWRDEFVILLHKGLIYLRILGFGNGGELLFVVCESKHCDVPSFYLCL